MGAELDRAALPLQLEICRVGELLSLGLWDTLTRDQPLSFTYDGQMRPFLLALRSQVIPSALIPFLYDIQPPVAFVDGCLVVEIQDFRRVPECRSRVVMRPAAESLAQTIDHMLERRGEPWDEQVSLELESRIIVGPPLETEGGKADIRP